MARDRPGTVFRAAALAAWLWAVPAVAAEPVWIDTDAACGPVSTQDADDCWALYLAHTSPELDVRGVGSVFGNVGVDEAHRIARRVVSRFVASPGVPVYTGAAVPLAELTAETPAVMALADALEAERLTLIALGPLTNVADLLRRHPGLAPRIRGVVAVAGPPPDSGFAFPAGRARVLQFHDLNFRNDSDAFEAVLKAGVPVTLMPFETTTQVTILAADVAALRGAGPGGRWLADQSVAWLSFWETALGAEGFHPFDALALGTVVRPGWFDCPQRHARVVHGRSRFVHSRPTLEVGDDLPGGAPVRYCRAVDRRFKALLLERLSGAP
ncbi:MAG: nucleoside hydrolase [Nitrospirae bacterium]|nr:nucleoside hydrolase [Nitrospirota bacterium]